MSNTNLTQLNTSINTFLKIIKGTVNDKKFGYDDKGLDDAIEYATQLMRDGYIRKMMMQLSFLLLMIGMMMGL